MPRHLWTSETAKAASLIASQARTQAAEARRLNPPAPAPVAPEAPPEAEPYAKSRLARVRKQLDMIDDRITELVKSGGTKDLKELIEAQTRLSEQERVLDGRPAPGQLRPTAQRSAPRPVGGLAPRAAESAPNNPPPA